MEALQSLNRPTVVERTSLWKGGVVSIKIPLEARLGQLPEGAPALSYFEFPRTVPGGSVKCYMHLRTPTDALQRGRRIRASVEVKCRTLSDGREYLYVDFTPVDDSTEISHRLAVVPDSVKIERGWWVFQTPSPLRGVIILAPPDTKIN